MPVDSDPPSVILSHKLTLTEVIGRGGFGIVYKAEHHDWGTVVVKKLQCRISEGQLQKLKAEAAVQSKLRHANITQFFGIVWDPELYAVVMDHEYYGSLDSFLNNYHVNNTCKLKMVYDIILGMNYLHTQSPIIIHRDLKIQNVLVSESIRMKISDFGLAELRPMTTTSQDGSPLCGTATHIPPECWRQSASRPNERFDVYSFGIVLWEIITQQEPFKGLPCMVIGTQVAGGLRPDLKLVSQCMLRAEPHTQILATLMVTSWVQEADQRPSFGELKGTLEAVIQKDDVSTMIEESRSNLLREIRDKLSLSGSGSHLADLDDEAAEDSSGSAADPASLPSAGSSADEYELYLPGKAAAPVSRPHIVTSSSPSNCGTPDPPVPPLRSSSLVTTKDFSYQPESTPDMQLNLRGPNTMLNPATGFSSQVPTNADIPLPVSDVHQMNSEGRRLTSHPVQRNTESLDMTTDYSALGRYPPASDVNSFIDLNAARKATPGNTPCDPETSPNPCLNGPVQTVRAMPMSSGGALMSDASAFSVPYGEGSGRDTIAMEKAMAAAEQSPPTSRGGPVCDFRPLRSGPRESRDILEKPGKGEPVDWRPADDVSGLHKEPLKDILGDGGQGAKTSIHIGQSQCLQIGPRCSMNVTFGECPGAKGCGASYGPSLGGVVRPPAAREHHDVPRGGDYISAVTRDGRQVMPLAAKPKTKLKVPARALSVADMTLLSSHVGQDWRMLGRHLGMADGELDNLWASHAAAGGQREAVYQMLREWASRQGRDATLLNLAKVMLVLKRVDLIRLIEKQT